MEYKPSFIDQLDIDYICHHGIKGMHWGIRRFQNPDGSLTSSGKKRYSDSKEKTTKPQVVAKVSYTPNNQVIKASAAFTERSNDLMRRYDTDGYDNVIKGVHELTNSTEFKKECFNEINKKERDLGIDLTKNDIHDLMTDAAWDFTIKHVEQTPSGKKAAAYQNELNSLFDDINSQASGKDKEYILKSIHPFTSYRARHDVFEVAIFEEDDVWNYLDNLSDQLADEYIQTRM